MTLISLKEFVPKLPLTLKKNSKFSFQLFVSLFACVYSLWLPGEELALASASAAHQFKSIHTVKVFPLLRPAGLLSSHQLRNMATNIPKAISNSKGSSNDIVLINKLAVNAITGTDFWHKPTLQPLNVSVKLRTDFKASSRTDDLKHSLNYAVISRNIVQFFDSKRTHNFKSIENLGKEVIEVVLDERKGGGQAVELRVDAAKTEIRADQVSVVLNRAKVNGVIESTANDRVLVKDLRVSTLIGVFTFERLQKQYVLLDLDIEYEKESKVYDIIDSVAQYVEASNFKTVEALIDTVAQIVCGFENVIQVTAKVEKPNAITYAQGVGVQVTRAPRDFVGAKSISIPDVTQRIHEEGFNLPTPDQSASISGEATRTAITQQHTAYIAFGSNVGNQFQNILKAIEHLNQIPNTKVEATSSLYESEPMYHLDQPSFLNGVLKLSTQLSPHALLSSLKKIEYDVLAREKLIENGPRSIDLDIVLYDDLIMNTPDLTIPHISMIERTFVLQPLCDLIGPEEIHPVTAEPYHNHLKQLFDNSESASSELQSSNLLKTHVPLYNSFFPEAEPRSITFDLVNGRCVGSHKTQMMGILNTTPDSFSDGGSSSSLETAVANALKMAHDGTDIIDIGGVSTRPGSIAPSVDEERRRVVPLVRAIRSHEDPILRNVIISVDTYRAIIAQEAVEAGADMINDVSGGLYDDDMFDVVAKCGVPYIMNHTRGTPETMSSLTSYTECEDPELVEYTNVDDGVNSTANRLLLNGIGRELSSLVEKAVQQGVQRWQLITDPGIGFAKNLSQNLAIIRHTAYIKSYANYYPGGRFVTLYGLPILLGPSRKKFIGTLTGEKEASERKGSTAAVIMACIAGASDIVRVHDVREVKKVLNVGDALYRGVGLKE